jgi:hypothetical protein
MTPLSGYSVKRTFLQGQSSLEWSPLTLLEGATKNQTRWRESVVQASLQRRLRYLEGLREELLRYISPSALEKANEERLALVARKFSGEVLSPADEERLAAATARVKSLSPRVTRKERKYLRKVAALTNSFQKRIKRIRGAFNLDQPT